MPRKASSILIGLMLVAIAKPASINATTTLTGTQTSNTNATDNVVMNSVSTNGFTIATSVVATPAIQVNGATSINSNITTTGNAPIYFTDGYSAIQEPDTVAAEIFASIGMQQGTYEMNGGTIEVGTWFNIASRGNNSFTLNNGTILDNGSGGGNFGGTSGAGGIDVGGREVFGPTANGKATLTINGGTITAANMGVGHTAFGGGLAGDHIEGHVVQEAGVTVNLISTTGYNAEGTAFRTALVISRPNNITTVTPESSYTLHGGTLSITGANTKVYDTGRFQGYGTVTTTSARTLDNSGRVVADGSGIDSNVLNLSQYGTIVNSIENTAAHGWYAQDNGKLTLPTLNVASGDSTVNWGESSADTTIDLVNSVRLGFDDVQTAGGVSIALLAPDRADVPAAPIWSFFGVWDIAPVSPFALGGGSADLTFRYDDAAAGINNVHLYHHVGGVWTELAVSPSGGSFTIAANDVTSLGLFAVAVPEPSSCALLGLGSMVLVSIGRRLRAN